MELSTRSGGDVVPKIAAVVGFLVVVELTSGVIQGYFTPLYTDIARHLGIHDADVNWFEAAQLLVSAVTVPVLARLGDIVGHKRVLLLSSAITACAAWGVAFAPNFWLFLIAWALMGPYVVWLPLEIALVHRRTKGDSSRTRTAAAVLVLALEVGVIAGALTSGALQPVIGMTGLLAIPAVAITACFVVIWFGVPETPPTGSHRLDLPGAALLCGLLLAVMAGLMLVRFVGPGSPWPWLALVVGAGLVVPFVRHEMRHPDPVIDVRLLRERRQLSVQLATGLFGFSVLGAQIPLSTFARTDPDVTGYGLGASAGGVSMLIGGYVLSMGLGAVTAPALAKRLGEFGALAVAACLVALGYGLNVVSHGSVVGLLVNMMIAGIGSGALVAALPVAAAGAAPASHTGQMTGLTNMAKTVGGAIASSIFALCLASAGQTEDVGDHAPLGGYLAVWAICSATAVGAALLLWRARRVSGGLKPD